MHKEIEAVRARHGAAILPGHRDDHALMRAGERLKGRAKALEALLLLCHVAEIPEEHAAPRLEGLPVGKDGVTQPDMLGLLERLGEPPATPAHDGFLRAAKHLRPTMDARHQAAMVVDFLGLRDPAVDELGPAVP